MIVLGNGQDHAGAGTGLRSEAMHTFRDVPAVVLAAFARCGLDIHFLVLVLAHVGNKEVAGLPVKRKTPGIPQAQRPDLRRAPFFPKRDWRGTA
jgi:hypothetical protein